MNSGIYQIINIKNGKSYIGSSLNLKLRFTQHINKLKNNKHPNKHLQRSWNKYGSSSFEFRKIQNMNLENLIQAEQYWIDYLKPEYNKRLIAESNKGWRHSQESKDKITESLLGDKNPFYGKHHTDKTKLELSQKLSGRRHTPEAIELIKQAGLGRHFSEETRTKLSTWQIGRKFSTEAKHNMSLARKRYLQKKLEDKVINESIIS